jgi:hypothetical protein
LPGEHSSFVSASNSPIARRLEGRVIVIRALIVGLVLFLVFTFPATFLLMLFLGNVGLHLSYWGTLPLGTIVSVLIGASGSIADARSI